ncbi:hypothetical protein TSOC_000142, partial [Tetrabaena socialis]
ASRQVGDCRARLLALRVPDVGAMGWQPVVVEKQTFYKCALHPPAAARPEWLEAPPTPHQVVASTEAGELVSVFDGVTKYAIGRWTSSKHGAGSWPLLSACLYGYPSAALAQAATFPLDSKLFAAPKVRKQNLVYTRTFASRVPPRTRLAALGALRVRPLGTSQNWKLTSLRAPTQVLIQFEASGKGYYNTQTSMWALPSIRPTRLLPSAVIQSSTGHTAAARGSSPWMP